MKKLVRIIIGAVLFFTALLLPFEGIARFLLFAVPYIILGYDVVFKAGKHIIRGKLLDENFLMTLATVGAFAIGEYPEAAAVMLFYQVGEMFQDYASEKSKKSVKALMKLRPESVRVMRDGKQIMVDPSEVMPGEIIVVNQGEVVALDGKIIKGETFLDTAVVTGESVPFEASEGSSVVSGSVNLNGVIHIEVSKPYGQSVVSRIIDLAQTAAEKKTKSERFITRFAKIYTPAVVGLAVLISVVPPLFTGFDFPVWIYRALIFLVISCPCALVLSVPMSYFAGLGGASRSGILVKGGNSLEALAKAGIFVFDKTGTLTEGSFRVVEIVSEDKQELLRCAAIAEKTSPHPVAVAIKKAYTGEIPDADKINEEFGKGVECVYNGEVIVAGNEKIMEKHKIDYSAASEEGSVVYVAKNNICIGYIVVSDKIKQRSAEAVVKLKKQGALKTVILTGDSRHSGETVAAELGTDEVYSELLPEQKVEKIRDLISEKPEKSSVIFVGDGINDAPALACADVGIAMGGIGSDAAVEAADAVIMNDDLTHLVSLVKIARRTRRVVGENVVFALVFKAAVMVLGALGLAGMWPAVVADVGVAAIAALNALRCLKKES